MQTRPEEEQNQAIQPVGKSGNNGSGMVNQQSSKQIVFFPEAATITQGRTAPYLPWLQNLRQ
jgi:hypothetical protein